MKSQKKIVTINILKNQVCNNCNFLRGAGEECEGICKNTLRIELNLPESKTCKFWESCHDATSLFWKRYNEDEE